MKYNDKRADQVWGQRFITRENVFMLCTVLINTFYIKRLAELKKKGIAKTSRIVHPFPRLYNTSSVCSLNFERKATRTSFNFWHFVKLLYPRGNFCVLVRMKLTGKLNYRFLRKSRWFYRSRSLGLRIYRKSALAAISAIERDASFEGKFPFEQVETSSENSRLPGDSWQCLAGGINVRPVGNVHLSSATFHPVEFEVRSRENQSTWSLLGPNWNYQNFWSTSDNSQRAVIYVVSLWVENMDSASKCNYLFDWSMVI